MAQSKLKKLGEDKGKLVRDREAMESSIHLRHATLLRLVGDAHNRCLNSLGQVCDDLSARLDSKMTKGQQAVATFQQILSQSEPPPVIQAIMEAQIFTTFGDVNDLLHFLLPNCLSASFLKHETRDMPWLTKNLDSFMGKAMTCCEDAHANLRKKRKKLARSRNLPSDQSLQSSEKAAPSSSPVSDSTAWEELSQKVTALTSQVSSLQASNTLLTQQVTSLNSASSCLSSEQSHIQRELSGVKEKSSRLTSDQAVLHREVTALKDKNSIVHQDLAVQNADRENMRAQLDVLQEQVVTVQTECSALKSDIKKNVDQLKTECTTLKSDVKKDVDQLKTEFAALKSDLKKDVDQLKTECSTSKTKIVDQLKTDFSVLKSYMQNNVDQLKTDCSAMKTEMDECYAHQDCEKEILKFTVENNVKNLNELMSGMSEIQSSISAMKEDHSALLSEQKSSENQIGFLKKELESAKTSLRNETHKLSHLKSRVGE